MKRRIAYMSQLAFMPECPYLRPMQIKIFNEGAKAGAAALLAHLKEKGILHSFESELTGKESYFLDVPMSEIQQIDEELK
jgi:hypothetical protein